MNWFSSESWEKLLLLILLKNSVLRVLYSEHLIKKWSSFSTAERLHCLQHLFSSRVFGIVYRPLSISKLCELTLKRDKVLRELKSFMSKHFSSLNSDLNLQYARILYIYIGRINRLSVFSGHLDNVSMLQYLYSGRTNRFSACSGP